MNVKVLIIFFSMLGATFFVSGGYGYWEKTLKITGEIEVFPDPDLHPVQAEISTPSEVDELITNVQENVTQENSDVISPQSNEESISEEMNGIVNEGQTDTEGEDTATQGAPAVDNTEQALYGEGVNSLLPKVGEQK